jgi:hypothetical protein
MSLFSRAKGIFSIGNGRGQAEPQAPVDFRDLLGDPLAGGLRAQGRPFLMRLPFSRMRDLPPICPGWEANPFLLTARACLEDPALAYAASPLRSFFEHVRPETAAEVLETATAPLAAMAAAEASLPWGPSGPKARQARLETAERHARAYGVALRGEDGHYSMGPVSERKGEFELMRLRRTLDSIRSRGYRPATLDDNIRGYLLERDGDWAFMILSGTHRAPVLLALGETEVDVVVVPARTIRRADAAEWASVRAGLLSAEQARAVFDRIFEGRDVAWLDTRWPPALRAKAAGPS